jgi:RNA polymerase sigma-70 factor (ECF subfamily)
MAKNEDSNRSDGTKAAFPSHTRWTLIVAASGPASSPAARAALDELCKLYWFPLYALIRREGYDSHQAKDLTQEFLGHVLETELFKKADARRGRFRSFLWESCRNFLKDEWRKGAAQKRGGGADVISIDEQEAETHYGQLPKAEPSPDKTYDQAWAKTVIQRVFQKLDQQYAREDQAQMYQVFTRYLVAEPDEVAYQELVQRLGRDKAALQLFWHRLRRRFGEVLRKEIEDIVEDPKEVSAEIRYLLAAWAAGTPTTSPG